MFQLGNFMYLKINKLKQKFDSMIFGTHCNTYFKQTSNFPKFLVKTSCEKIY